MPDTPDRHALLRAAAATLPGDTPRLDAELFLAHALGEPRLQMLAGQHSITSETAARFEAMLARRRRHEPVAHILGAREFWSLPFKVSPDVLVPRPDSETLLVEALVHFKALAPATILDLGTGSGALLLAALSEWPAAIGLGIDCSEAALVVARANALALGLADRATFQPGHWADGLEGPFDLLLCNPPYIPDGTALMPDVAAYEPPGALYGGADGLDPYRALLPQVARLLAPGGVALFEFGPGQAGALLQMATRAGLSARTADDLAGRSRALVLTPAKLLVPPDASV